MSNALKFRIHFPLRSYAMAWVILVGVIGGSAFLADGSEGFPWGAVIIALVFASIATGVLMLLLRYTPSSPS
jgi:hypothetical protein